MRTSPKRLQATYYYDTQGEDNGYGVVPVGYPPEAPQFVGLKVRAGLSIRRNAPYQSLSSERGVESSPPASAGGSGIISSQ